MRLILAALLLILVNGAVAQEAGPPRTAAPVTPEALSAVLDSTRYVPLVSYSVVGAYVFSTGFTGGRLRLHVNGLYTYDYGGDSRSSSGADRTPAVWGYYVLAADTLHRRTVGLAHVGGCHAPQANVGYQGDLGGRSAHVMKRVGRELYAVQADSVSLRAFAEAVLLRREPHRTAGALRRVADEAPSPHAPHVPATEPFVPGVASSGRCDVQAGLPLDVSVEPAVSTGDSLGVSGLWRVRGQARDALTGGAVARLEVCRHAMADMGYCAGPFPAEVDAAGRFELVLPLARGRGRLYVRGAHHREVAVPVSASDAAEE